MILLSWVPPGQSALAERPPPREGYNSDPVTNNIGLPASSDSLTVVAIVAAYNEADIIDQVVRDLITQGVQVYLLDDGSTDGTVEAVEHYVGSGVVGIERLEHGEGDAGARFYWERILFRKAQIAQHIDATWFIHHDADEFRESPWFGVPLREAIAQVDRLGFNAIDAASFDFWPVDDSFGPGVDVRVALPYYSRARPFDKLQVRCWKKTDALVDLASTGGHDVQFPGRMVFPQRFILRHYPIRSQSHGDRKVFEQRLSRFLPEELKRGWHLQYAEMSEGTSFIRDPSTLTLYDPLAVRTDLALHRGVEAMSSAIDALRDEADRLRTEQSCDQNEIARLAEEGARKDTALSDMRSVVEALLAERDARALDVQERERLHLEEVARYRAVVEDTTRRLDAMHRSMSWRLTSPLRAAYRIVGGR